MDYWESPDGAIKLWNCDCMELMAQYPDKHFDLAIVDPPYGIGAGKAAQGKWVTSRMEKKDWDSSPPSPEYFTELFRASTDQIIWGGNYFKLRPSRAFVVWDKGEGFYNRDFAECEQAWVSRDGNAKIFKWDPLARGDYRGKIHPTQKPVALYGWLLRKYAQPGQLILDTHLGSCSSVLAAIDFGCKICGCEIDTDYFKSGVERIERHLAQGDMFRGAPLSTAPITPELSF